MIVYNKSFTMMCSISSLCRLLCCTRVANGGWRHAVSSQKQHYLKCTVQYSGFINACLSVVLSTCLASYRMRCRRAPKPRQVRPMFPVFAGMRGRKRTTCSAVVTAPMTADSPPKIFPSLPCRVVCLVLVLWCAPRHSGAIIGRCCILVVVFID